MTIDVFEADMTGLKPAQPPLTASEKIAYFLDTATPVQLGLIAFALFALAYIVVYTLYQRKRR